MPVGDLRPVVISRATLTRIQREAAAMPEQEVCGLLLGTPNRIEAAEACANVDPNPARAFEIDPAALLAAHRAERAGGRAMIGCYHSHPQGPATPSARDAASAEPGRLWLILGAGEARLWLAQAEGFAEVVLIEA